MKLRIDKLIHFFMLIIIDFSIYIIACNFFSFFDMNYRGIFSLFRNNESIWIPFYITLIAFFTRKLYFLKTYLVWEEMKRIIISGVVSILLLLPLELTKVLDLNIRKIITIYMFFIPIDIIIRYFYRVTMTKIGLLRTNVVIIGSGFQGIELDNIVTGSKFTTYNVVGYLDDEKKEINNRKVLGKIKDVEKVIKENKIHEVIIAIPKVNRVELSEVISRLEGKVRRIKYIPDMYGLMTFSTEINDYDRVLAITSAQGLLNPLNRFYKRVFDMICGLIGIVLTFIVYAVVYTFVKLDDNGPVLFTQERIGINGTKIKIWKFRTMMVDAEKKLEEMMAKDEKLREEYLTNKKLEKDPRITKIGSFLRKTSLDEFPQFINVLMGEMSIVGPRPYLFREKIDMGDKYSSIIKVKPGITGLWQASGRSNLSFDERTILDQYYIRNWSIWFDIIIILKTINAVLKKDGAK